MLILAASARRSGLLAPGAQLLPARLRVWALVVELGACGTALDGAELVPASLCGVSLAPWLAYRHQRSYSALDQEAASYAALTPEVLLFEAALGDEPPSDQRLVVPTAAAGVANAVVWTWEVDLDDSGAPPLRNAAWAPRTHWRQVRSLHPPPLWARPSSAEQRS